MRALTILTVTAALALAGCASDGAPDGTSDDTAAEAPADEGAAGGSLTFTGTDATAWQEAQKSTGPGSVEVTLECGAGVGHTLAFEGVQGGEPVAECGPDGSGSATVELEAGEYTYFCTVPGHREAGMEGELIVE